MLRSIVFLLASLLFGLFTLSDSASSQGGTWQSLGGPTGGVANVRDLAVGKASGASSATIYDVDASAFYRSTNGGTSWTQITSLPALPLAVACKPATASRVVAGLNGSMWYSDNSGGSWSFSFEGDPNFVPVRLAVAPASSGQQLMFVGIWKYGGLVSMMKSTNGGVDWDGVDSFFGEIQTDVTAIAPHQTSGTLVFAGGTTPPPRTPLNPPLGPAEPTAVYTNGVFFSTNSGADWSSSGNLAKNVTAMAAYTRGSQINVFAATDQASNKLYRSTNANTPGATWTSVTFPGGLISDLRSDQNNNIYAVTATGVWKSTNDGTWWTSVTACGVDPNNARRIGIDPQNGNNLFLGTAQTFHRSTDGGATWMEATATTLVPLGTEPDAAKTNSQSARSDR